ncbi:MAG: WYL domain-containing protein [Nocardioides sp.]|uniref:helix-turn-helix transcriptional regulator n=1 Tax=Nocardioides sp. TaxID=35761 RepID=UPI0039E57138
MRAGRALPPLLLDDEEAIAVAVSLQLATDTVSGASDAAVRTLAKLDQVLPPRLRHSIRALHDATDSLPSYGARGVDGEALMTIARACRDRVRVRFGYADRGGVASERTVEPVGMVTAERRWYLLAWDVDREDWRTFRLDRARAVTASTWRFPAREHPDPAAYVQRSVTAAPYRFVARVLVAAPAEMVRGQLSARAATVTPVDEGSCELVAGADDLTWLACHLAVLGHPWHVLDPPELRAAAARLGALLSDAGAVVS